LHCQASFGKKTIQKWGSFLKEPYQFGNSAEELYISIKEPYIPAKEPDYGNEALL